MAKTLQFRRGTTSELSTQTGAVGELFVDTQKDTVVVMDGSTAGGFPLAKESVLANYATTAALSGNLANYATTSQLSSNLANYPTKNELSGNLANYATTAALSGNLANYATTSALTSGLSGKQDTLVSNTSIKTINGTSLLGSGDITISGGSGVDLTSGANVFIGNAASGCTFIQIDGTYLTVNVAAAFTQAVAITGSVQANGTSGSNGQVLASNGSGVYWSTVTGGSSFSGSYNDLTDKPNLSLKQDTLISNTNIKTINNQSLLGSGNINISGGGADLSQVSEDILPSFSEVYDIGSANNRWYDTFISHKLDIAGAEILGNEDGVVIPNAALVDQLLISDNMITPDDTSVRQYFGDKGVVAINGNLDVAGDWLGTPVAQTLPAIVGKNPGDIDTDFDVGSGFNGSINKIKTLSDGKILVAGSFSEYNGITCSLGLARLNSDGTLDTTYNEGGFGFNTFVSDFDVQPDGKIIAVGPFLAYNFVFTPAQNGIARLNSDGSLDNSFNIGDGFARTNPNNPLYFSNVIVQPNGRIIVGGTFEEYDGAAQSCLIRLFSDGTKDTSFSSITLEPLTRTPVVFGLALQPDGKILVSGDFNRYGDTSVNSLIRINSNGSLDSSFIIDNNFNTSYGYAVKIKLQPDGKILILPALDVSVIKLNTDGSYDNTFTNIDGGAFRFSLASIYDIALQSDGKILVGGGFSAYNLAEGTGYEAIPALRIVRFNSDGSRDTEFQSGIQTSTNFNAAIITIDVLEDNKILVGGGANLLLTRLHTEAVTGRSASSPPIGGEEGFIRYNKDITAFQGYNGTSWQLLERVTTPPTDLATEGTVDIDFSGASLSKQGNLTGSVTYTGSNYLPGSSVTIRVVNGNVERDITFPTGWVFVGETPTSIASGATAILTVTSFGTTESDCVAAWATQA